MPPRKKKTEKDNSECRKDLHCQTQSIVSLVAIASVYANEDAFARACVHAAADTTGPKTWGTRYCGHDKHATLFRTRFLSAGTKGIRKTLLMAAAASVALGAVAGQDVGAGVVAAVAAGAAIRKLAARLEARGLFSPEGKDLRGPVLEQARKTMGRLYSNMNFGFTTVSAHQVMTGLACGTEKLRNALPEATPCPNCKWGWVSTFVYLNGILRNQFARICDAADAIRPALQEMNDAADIKESLEAAARSLETARLSGSDDALTSAFGELRAVGIDVLSGDVDVIASNLKERLEPATALFIEKRDAARVLLTGTTDEIKTRETTGDGTGRSRRYVATGLGHITKIQGEYDQDMGQTAQENEEAGLKHFQTCREEAMAVAETVGIEFIAQPGAVTLGGIKDLNNRTPLLAGPGNHKGLVKGEIKPGDMLKVPSQFIPNRPQLETDFAMLAALIRVMTLVRVGFLTAGLPGDLADIFITSSAVQNYLTHFFGVRKRNSIKYGKSEGTLVAGVCVRFMWRPLGSDGDWKELNRGPTSMEDKGYPSISGADWLDAPSVGSYDVLGTTVDNIWGPQTERDANPNNRALREFERKAILDADRAGYVADAFESVANGGDKPLFMIEEDGVHRSMRIGVMGTGYHQESTVVHDPNLEESFNVLAMGGAELISTGSGSVFESPVDLVVLPITTNYTTLLDKADVMYDLKTGCKILVLEWFLKDLASYDGEDFMGDAALAFREKSAVFGPSGKTIHKGRFKGKPRYGVKAELKAATLDRFAAHRAAFRAMRAL